MTTRPKVDTERHVGHAPRSHALGHRIVANHAACIGCTECRGLCEVLIELYTLPEDVLGEADRADRITPTET